MSNSDYLTTGEASALLKVSRSTVSRKYDQGVLRGRTNPITGERMVARDSVLSLMRQYDIPIPETVKEERAVLVCVADPAVMASLRGQFGADDRVIPQYVETGCEALVQCAKGGRGLLILDSELPDIACADVLKALGKDVASDALDILCIAADEKLAVAQEWGAGQCIARTELMGEDGPAGLYDFLGLPHRPGVVKTDYEHHRQWPRVTAEIPVKLSVYRLSAPKVRDQGEALIRDISGGGALLTNVKLEVGTLPLEPFRMVLQSNDAPLPDWRVHAQVVRLRSGEPMHVAVQFVKISTPDREKVTDYVASVMKGEG